MGHLGSDPKTTTTQSGRVTSAFSVATSKTWTKDNQKQSKTTWHRVVCWGKLAENVGIYLHKGSLVLVEGEIEHREYEKDGAKHNITEILASTVHFLSKDGDSPRQANTHDIAAQEMNQQEFTHDDVPF
jgi:single-strand DNA-binding protein